MRLIDADALINDIRKHSQSYFADDFAHEWVDKQPTVDAVEVVRCKDCKLFDSDMEWCDADEHPISPDAFCSYAERRDA